MLNILVVDDSMIMRRNIKKHLTSLGHNIIGEAQNGEEAILFCQENNPDLITMDISMSGISGIEVVQKIKELNSDFSIIMITAYGKNNLVKESLKSGAKGYILKPVSEENLYESIGKIYPKYLDNTK